MPCAARTDGKAAAEGSYIHVSSCLSTCHSMGPLESASIKKLILLVPGDDHMQSRDNQESGLDEKLDSPDETRESRSYRSSHPLKINE